MSRQSRIVIVSAALIAALSGIAQAGTVRHHSPARTVQPTAEASLHQLQGRNAYGMAIAQPQPSCTDITCPGYGLVGIGF